MFELATRRYDDPIAADLIAQVQAEYVTRYGGVDAAVVDPAEFVPPRGLFLVGLLDGDPVASGGWRRLDDQTAEIKRMYVAPRARGRGLARAALARLEATAVRDGIRRLLLNTGTEQPEAVALYESSGYRPATPFGHYASTPGALFYGKELGLQPVAGPGTSAWSGRGTPRGPLPERTGRATPA